MGDSVSRADANEAGEASRDTITLPCGHIMMKKSYSGAPCWVCEKPSKRTPKKRYIQIVEGEAEEVKPRRPPPSPLCRKAKKDSVVSVASIEQRAITISFPK